MAEDKVHGLDAAEIFRVHDMLAAGHGMNFGIQVGAQLGGNLIEDGNAGHLKFPASVFQHVADFIVDDGIQNETRIFANAVQDFLDLFLGPDHGPKMFMGVNGIELDQTRARHHADSFSRRIRYQMNMKGFKVFVGHLALRAVWG
jgi:hypothetical protein